MCKNLHRVKTIYHIPLEIMPLCYNYQIQSHLLFIMSLGIRKASKDMVTW